MDRSARRCASTAPTRRRRGSPASRSATAPSACGSSSRRPWRASRCSWRRCAPRSTPATFAGRGPGRQRHARPTIRGSGGRSGSRGSRRSPAVTSRRRRPRSTPRWARCPASSRPKLALALACEQTGAEDLAEQLYAVCAATDANYVAPAAFGLARTRAARGDLPASLAGARSRRPTSGAYVAARRRRAELLTASTPGLPALAGGRGQHRGRGDRPARPAQRSRCGSSPPRSPRWQRVGDQPPDDDRRRSRDRHRRCASRPRRPTGIWRPSPRIARSGSDSSTPPTRSARGRWCDGLPAACGARDRRTATSSARAAARPSATGPRRRPDREPSRRRVRTDRARRRRSRPRAARRRPRRTCSCGGVIDADGWCTVCGLRAANERDHTTEQLVAGRRGGLRQGAGARPQRGCVRAGGVRRAGRAGRVRRRHVDDRQRRRVRWPRPAPPRRARATPPPAPAPAAGAVGEYWTDALERGRARRAARGRKPRRRGRVDENPPSCTFVAAVVDGPVLVAGVDRRQPLLLVRRRRHRGPGVGRRLVGERRDRPRHRRVTRPSATPVRTRSPVGWVSMRPTRVPTCASVPVAAGGWVLVCSDGLWNYCSEAKDLRAAARPSTSSVRARMRSRSRPVCATGRTNRAAMTM